MKQIKYWLNTYFIYNKRERNGILVLCSLIFVLLLLRIFQEQINNTFFPERVYHNLLAGIKFDSVPQNQPYYKTFNTQYSQGNSSVKEKQSVNINYFKFNPNNLPVEKWLALGMTESQIRIIKNFEQRGGKFFKKEDLKKIYSIKSEQYARLEPFIEIPEKTLAENNSSKAERKQEILMVDLNTADEAELEKLPLIGPALSSRIIKYRDALGGFTDINQLKEVYGLDSVAFNKISPFLRVNQYLLNKININYATIDQLKKHPYLNYNIARSIVMLKDRFGHYKNIEEIKKSVLVNTEIYNKIQPYITVN